MMRSAAPQHLAPVVELLARSFPPAPRPQPRRWIKMRRAYDAVKSLLAMIGLAALAGLLFLPFERESLLPWVGAEPAGPAATVTAGSIGSHADAYLLHEQRELPAVVGELLEVEARDHLHQALRAHVALRHGVVARLDRHHGEDEQRVERVARAGPVGGVDEARDRHL